MKAMRKTIRLGTHGEQYGNWMPVSMLSLMGGLLALPVLLVLSVLMIFWGSGDYVRTVQLNWELELPASEG